MLAALRQRRDHVADRRPRHLRHPGLPGAGRPPARGGNHDPSIPNQGVIAALCRRSGGWRLRWGRRRPVGRRSGDAIKLGFSAWPGWFPWQVAEEKGHLREGGRERRPHVVRGLPRLAQRDGGRPTRRQHPDAERHDLLGRRRRRRGHRAGERQLDRQRPDHRRAGHQDDRRPQGQEDRRPSRARRPLPAAPRPREGGHEPGRRLIPAARDRRGGGRVRIGPARRRWRVRAVHDAGAQA